VSTDEARAARPAVEPEHERVIIWVSLGVEEDVVENTGREVQVA